MIGGRHAIVHDVADTHGAFAYARGAYGKRFRVLVPSNGIHMPFVFCVTWGYASVTRNATYLASCLR